MPTGLSINGLPLPPLLVELAETGRWKSPKHPPWVRRLLPGELFPNGAELVEVLGL